MVDVVRKRWAMWLVSLVAVVVLAGAAIAQVRPLLVAPRTTTALGSTARPVTVTPTRPPAISPIRP